MPREKQADAPNEDAPAEDPTELAEPEKVEPDTEPEGVEPEAEPVAARIEEYDAVTPGGEVVHIRHNIDTGDTEIVSE